MRKTSPKIETAHLNRNEAAELRCRTALELKDRGEYAAARDVMFPLWNGIGSRPDTKGLREDVVPRLLLCAGILTGWLGGQSETEKADDFARDLITESITLFESLGETRKVAEARAELGQCYWRAGANDEARIMYSTALERLATGGDAQATTLLAMSSVEWAESRYTEVLRILTMNAPLFERIANHTIKGTYYNQLGITFRALAPASRKRIEYYHRAIQHYHAADEQFRIARHVVFRAHVKNNIGNVMRDLHDFREAHKYQAQARRLFNRARDKVRVAQVDDSLALLFIAEGNYEQAELTASRAARSFERAGRKCLLAETLINQGIALARMCEEPARAQFIFQKAIETAYNAGSPNRAGLAALTMIEEIDTLSPQLQSVAFVKAKEWLASSDMRDIKRRLDAARKKHSIHPLSDQSIDVFDILFVKRRDLRAEVLQYEHELISQTLTKVNGKVTDAAELLNMNHQSLAVLIETKHPDLLKKRTPIVRRPRRTSRSKHR